MKSTKLTNKIWKTRFPKTHIEKISKYMKVQISESLLEYSQDKIPKRNRNQ